MISRWAFGATVSIPRTGHLIKREGYGGYAHTALPLPGRGLLVALCEYSPGGRERNGDKRIWIIDIRAERQP